MSALLGPNRTTQHDGSVQIEVPSAGPYGMILDAGSDGKGAVIKEWAKLPNGKFGIIQTHGGVRLNDCILKINDTDCTYLSFNQAC